MNDETHESDLHEACFLASNSTFAPVCLAERDAVYAAAGVFFGDKQFYARECKLHLKIDSN